MYVQICNSEFDHVSSYTGDLALRRIGMVTTVLLFFVRPTVRIAAILPLGGLHYETHHIYPRIRPAGCALRARSTDNPQPRNRRAAPPRDAFGTPPLSGPDPIPHQP